MKKIILTIIKTMLYVSKPSGYIMKENIKNRLNELFETYAGSNRYSKIATDNDVRLYLTKKYPQYDIDKDTSMIVSLFKLDLDDVPECANPKCTNKVSYQNRKFRNTCSQTCRRIMDNSTGEMQKIIKKARKTYKDKTGLDHQMHSDAVKNKIKETNLERYGTEYPTQFEEIKNKIKETNLERYGVECSLHNEDIIEKSKKTLMDRYGVDHPLRSEEIKNKIKETNLERYGVEYPMQSTDISNSVDRTNSLSNETRTKTKETNLERYGAENYFGSVEFKNRMKDRWQEVADKRNETKFDINFDSVMERISQTTNIIPMFTKEEYTKVKGGVFYDWKCMDCDNEFSDHISNGTVPICRSCNPRENLDEIKIKEFLTENNIEFVFGSRSIIAPYELDFFLPDYNIAIEYCGLYWHSTDFRPNTNYHVNKLNACLEKNIKLITIFSDDNWDQVLKRLSHLLGITKDKIYARKCTVKEITTKEARLFCDSNHLQGYGNSNIKLGLYHGDDLVSVMTFGNKNISRKSGEWEIIRFCSTVNVVGAAGKLFKHFLNTENPDKVISYADRRWSEGKVYETIGFKFDKPTKPNYWYFKQNKRVHRFTLRKGSVQEDDLSLTEFQNRANQGWKRIYDCGSNKYIYVK